MYLQFMGPWRTFPHVGLETVIDTESYDIRRNRRRKLDFPRLQKNSMTSGLPNSWYKSKQLTILNRQIPHIVPSMSHYLVSMVDDFHQDWRDLRNELSCSSADRKHSAWTRMRFMDSLGFITLVSPNLMCLGLLEVSDLVRDVQVTLT
jgi:hypothetical protein